MGYLISLCKKTRVNKRVMYREKVNGKITLKQSMFAYYYFVYGFNATESYRRSYNTSNMSIQTIYNKAYLLTKHPKISAEIRRLMSSMSSNKAHSLLRLEKLTKKQYDFIDNYYDCWCMNKSKAYRMTYNTSNMSNRTIHNKASLIMQKPKIILLLWHNQAMLRGEFR